MTYKQGHIGLLRAWFAHNIYYFRQNWIGRFLSKQNSLNRGISQLYELVGDILGAICIFAIGYMWLLVAGVLQ